MKVPPDTCAEAETLLLGGDAAENEQLLLKMGELDGQLADLTCQLTVRVGQRLEQLSQIPNVPYHCFAELIGLRASMSYSGTLSRHHIDKQRAPCLAARHIVSDIRLHSIAPASDSPFAAKATKQK